jgi:putative sterol carrier protein
MADATTEFMNDLGRRGHDPRLRKVNETVRFDLVNGEKTDRWLVHIEKGDVTVTHKGGAADTVIHADRRLFDRMARGEVNPVAAVLRGDARLEGAVKSVVVVQRLFPGPQAASHVQPSAPGGRKR